MCNLKKLVSILLAGTMVLGMSVTAFADTTQIGTGSIEGYIDANDPNVILPTVSGTTADGTEKWLDFKVDPQRLIQRSNYANYQGCTFPTKDADTGVYFLVAPKTYANESEIYKVANKSAFNVKVTVKYQAVTKSAADLNLATSESVDTDAPLYLGLRLGSATHPVSTSETTKSFVIAGAGTSTGVTVENGMYVMDNSNSTGKWKAIEVQLKGKVLDFTPETTVTTPNVKVVWSYAKAAASDPVSTSDQVDYITSRVSKSEITSSDNKVTLNLPTGITVTDVKLYNYIHTDRVTSIMTSCVISGNLMTISNAAMLNYYYSNDQTLIRVHFSDGKYETVWLRP